MPKFICQRNITSAEGYQEFSVEAENKEHARELFLAGEGEMFFTECEVIALSDYELDSIYEDG